MRLSRVPSFVVVATLLLAGCSDLAKMVSPPGTVDARPAQVALSASVTTASVARAADIVSLRVTSSYVVTGGARTDIGTQTIALTTAASQAVPIPVDLGTCLADGTRDGGTAVSGCLVYLELQLVVNSIVVDRQTVGPLRLAPGATTPVAQPVALYEITTVALDVAADNVLTVGSTRTVTPTIRDSRGQTVADRTVSWRSDAPAVATVDANGKVTAVGVGAARITASVGEIESGARFAVTLPPVSLTVVPPASNSGTGVIRSAPAGIDCRVTTTGVSGVCTFDFASGAQVILTSTADAGQTFGTWGGSCVGNAVGLNCTLTMAQSRSVSALFIGPRRLTVSASATDGRGRIFGDFGIECRVDGSTTSGVCAADVPDGTAVVLTSVADPGQGAAVAQVFAGWGGDCSTATGVSCTLSVTGADRAVSAGFFGGRTLTVTMAGNGVGTVTATGGIACSLSGGTTIGSCTQSTAHGTNVQLTVQTDAQTEFGGWTGACAGQPGNCTVSMTAARSATATFIRRKVPLTLTLSGSGNGSVSVNGDVACERTVTQATNVTCVREYDLGTTVTVTATAGTLTDFGGMTGDCNNAANCSLTVSVPRSLTALFSSKAPVTFTIEGLANGSGVVRSQETVPLIDCPIRDGIASGARCSTTVPIGTSITLQAIGNTNNALRFWSGACAARTTPTCTVVVDAVKSAVVGFTPAIELEMRLDGPGTGSITFQPDGAPSQLPCVQSTGGTATSCRFALPAGLSAVLRGEPVAGSRFLGFIGPCAESVSIEAVPVCTYRGVGFLRVFNGTFALEP